MFCLLASIALLSAQMDTPPDQVLPDAPQQVPNFESTVHAPSPSWTQDRSFTSTRFWLLDAGNYEVETWIGAEVPRAVNGVRGPTSLLGQQEVEIGVAPHLQLDLYENLSFDENDAGQRRIAQEGVQIEARIAIPRYYGQIPLNPVIYLEWHPRRANPDRAEIRLLLGGAVTPWLYLVANPYVEMNMETTDLSSPGTDAQGNPTIVKSSKYIADMELGTTLAAGFRITDWLRVSAEAKIGADMLGDSNNKFKFVAWAGPGFIIKPLRNNYLKIMGTCLFALPGTANDAAVFLPTLIVGSQF